MGSMTGPTDLISMSMLYCGKVCKSGFPDDRSGELKVAGQPKTASSDRSWQFCESGRYARRQLSRMLFVGRESAAWLETRQTPDFTTEPVMRGQSTGTLSAELASRYAALEVGTAAEGRRGIATGTSSRVGKDVDSFWGHRCSKPAGDAARSGFAMSSGISAAQAD